MMALISSQGTKLETGLAEVISLHVEVQSVRSLSLRALE